VGRWSRLLAARGATVTGVDLSPTMIAQAQRRAQAEGVAERCEFRVQDLARLDVDGPFDVVLGVTVLQHILDPELLHAAVRGMAARLAPGGRMILLEAAPAGSVDRCDSTVFRARRRDVYLKLFAECGLELRAMTGVDPAPLRMRLLPYLRRMPRSLSMSLLVLTTAVSLPVDMVLGRRALRQSWHAVFVLEQKVGGKDHGP